MTNSVFDDFVEFLVSDIPVQIDFYIINHCPLITARIHSLILLMTCPVPIVNHIAKLLSSVRIIQK